MSDLAEKQQALFDAMAKTVAAERAMTKNALTAEAAYKDSDAAADAWKSAREAESFARGALLVAQGVADASEVKLAPVAEVE